MTDIFSERVSPGFSEFRDLIDRWDENSCVLKHQDAIEDLLNKHDIVLFLMNGDELYGAPEPSRLIFAKLKTDTEDDPMMPGFRQEAQFPVINLARALSNDEEKSCERSFSLKDLPKLSVCPKEDAMDRLIKFMQKK